jgi:hypothetical protein
MLTDSSYQEAEIVFIRHCHNGEINVNFSLVKNIPKADADSISKEISTQVCLLLVGRGVARHLNECRHKAYGEGSGGSW